MTTEDKVFGGSVGKETACNAGDLASALGSGRSLGEGNGKPLQYSCLESHMVGGAWQTQAAVLGVSESQTRQSDCASRHTAIVSVTHSQPQSGNIKWKIPKLSNS